jgi:hypothetical protein
MWLSGRGMRKINENQKIPGSQPFFKKPGLPDFAWSKIWAIFSPFGRVFIFGRFFRLLGECLFLGDFCRLLGECLFLGNFCKIS